jgi:hypothetical protein
VRPPVIWLGELSPLFVFASNAVVTPCVGMVDHWPAWGACEAEVQCVVKLSLRELIETAPAPPLKIERGPLRFWRRGLPPRAIPSGARPRLCWRSFAGG